MFGFLTAVVGKVRIQHTRRNRGVLGAAAASTLFVALAVAAGVVPGPGATTTVRTASGESALAAAPTNATDSTADVGQAAATPEVSSTTVTTVTTAPAASPTTGVAPPPATAAPEPDPTTPAPVVAAPAPSAPAPAPAPLPRRQPSSAEVQQALDGIRPFVQTVFPLTHAHVNDLGNQVCTALDQGQTVEQVKATGLAKVRKVPFTNVLPGADDYVVRTAITLYCPGHAPKLG